MCKTSLADFKAAAIAQEVSERDDISFIELIVCFARPIMTDTVAAIAPTLLTEARMGIVVARG